MIIENREGEHFLCLAAAYLWRSVVTKIIAGEVRDFGDEKAIQQSREEARAF
jgi:hypothetical protein